MHETHHLDDHLSLHTYFKDDDVIKMTSPPMRTNNTSFKVIVALVSLSFLAQLNIGRGDVAGWSAMARGEVNSLVTPSSRYEDSAKDKNGLNVLQEAVRGITPEPWSTS